MVNLDFFNRLGLFIEKDFLTNDFCTQYLAEVHQSSIHPVNIVQHNGTTGVVSTLLEKKQRKTNQIAVSSATKEYVRSRLLAIKPTLEHHFKLTLTDCQKPLFYLYKEGDFFEMHRDCTNQLDVPEFIQKRRISVVIFINSWSDDAKLGFYNGGSLTFYGLIDSPQWQEYGFPLFGEQGLLVAFPSDVLHEVKPVIYGDRYTIATWFY